jgi:hypothetical protein
VVVFVVFYHLNRIELRYALSCVVALIIINHRLNPHGVYGLVLHHLYLVAHVIIHLRCISQCDLVLASNFLAFSTAIFSATEAAEGTQADEHDS